VTRRSLGQSQSMSILRPPLRDLEQQDPIHSICHPKIIPKSHIETMSSQSNTNSLPETTTANSPAAPKPDQDFYTWSTFFNILTGGATPQEREAYFDIKDTINEDRDIARAEKDRKWLLEYSPIVRFMRHNINLLGHDLNETNMRVKRCTTQQSGGFDPDYGILLCANKFRNRGHMEDTMAHEMVHAYDHLRFKLDPLDLRHAACMEVC
jgi:inner membrane protease ATP23